jgi:hypothetical protein
LTKMRIFRTMILDEQGNVVTGSEHEYPLEGSCKTINEIEGAVEKMARQALPDLEHALLDEAQVEWNEEKKGNWSAKGTKKHK